MVDYGLIRSELEEILIEKDEYDLRIHLMRLIRDVVDGQYDLDTYSPEEPF